MSTDKPADTTARFQYLPERQQSFVVLAHGTAFKLSSGLQTATLKKIFEIGNPNIVIGEDQGKPYCRIERDSVDVMKVLMREYL